MAVRFWIFKGFLGEIKIQKNAKILNTFRPQWVKLDPESTEIASVADKIVKSQVTCTPEDEA